VNTVYVIAVMSSLKCGVKVLRLPGVEPDLRCYASDAHVRDQLRALYDCVASWLSRRTPGMIDAAGILEDLAKAILEAGLAKHENTSDAQA